MTGQMFQLTDSISHNQKESLVFNGAQKKEMACDLVIVTNGLPLG